MALNFIIDSLLAFFTLSLIEIVLGIDNVIFINLLVNNLDQKSKYRAKILSIVLILIIKLFILSTSLKFLENNEVLFSLEYFELSPRSLVLLTGGTLLVSKSILEIVEMFFEASGKRNSTMKPLKSSIQIKHNKIFGQILMINSILAVDSVMSALSLNQNFYLIISVFILSIFIMIMFTGFIVNLIYKYDTIRILILCFLIFLGIKLLLTSFNIYLESYIFYIAFIFSGIVQTICIVYKNLKNNNPSIRQKDIN